MKILDVNRSIVENLSLGRVSVGTEKVFEFYLQNDEANLIEDIKVNLVFDSTKLPEGVVFDEIKILEYPRELKEGETGKLVVSWKPKLKLKESLNPRLRIERGEVWYL